MSFYDHAERELDHIGMTDDGDMNGMMRKHLLHMVNEFAEEGHSGFSASYAIQCLEKLLRFEPLSPLTGEDWEWRDVGEMYGEPVWQNMRCSRVFKNSTGAYDTDGKVFVEWSYDKEKDDYVKSSYTSAESRVPVTFPYVPKTEYVEINRPIQPHGY